jgi:predicted nucleotidyltransferase component of viral defense system
MFHLSTVDDSTFQLLQTIFKTEFVKTRFALADGTSLALQVGHRKSVDLDFFSEREFSPRELEIVLAAIKTWQYEPVNSSERMLFCFIDKVKCDFVNEPFQLIEPFQERDGILLYSLKDIAAMKLHTICGRGMKKDFFDVYVLIQLFGWNQLLK